MATTPEYCPVAMGAEIVAERWNLLIIRELIVEARRFNDIHRGLPGLSRTLLSQRLRVLQRCGLLEPVPADDPGGSGYRLTEAGAELRPVLQALGTWAVRWRFPEPSDDQLDPHLLMWRMLTGLAHDRVPGRRIVIEFSFENGRTERGWLIVDGAASSICARDPMFGVDLYASAPSRVWHEIWYGHRSMREPIRNGDVVLTGAKDLVAGFADWFHLSHFAQDVARQRQAAHTPGHHAMQT